MKLTFLGTSDGIPRPGHFCTSTLLEVGEALYLFDAGAPVIDLLLQNGKHPNALRAFFNTHGHGDHLDGLLHLVDLCCWAYRDTSFALLFPERRVLEAVESYNTLIHPADTPYPSDRLRAQVYEAGVIYDDGILRVTAIPTEHCRPRPSYSFWIEAEGKRILLTGDLRGDARDFPTAALTEESDLILCEMAHFGENEIAPWMEKCRTKRFLFHHYQLRKEAHIERLRTSGRFPYPVDFAHDGETIEL